ncbi:hypothetical protein BDV96DRAFT_655080 [Lophiotrema nucula]|uniref:Deoxyribonuclease NucA/NucB domain-containing protein n=1 Tax=Lophiotrema nucula TaxID=690887 RepID=A0A6A5YFL5_9PLEO|nr:hypothetical protein BDV96DRAFT_655080 [Lophiotrema nucula]
MPTAMVVFLRFVAIAAANPLGHFNVRLDTRSPPQAHGIQFDCNTFPQVCANMCWGIIYPYLSPTIHLVYDKASSSKKRERRKAAGCLDNLKPGNNRCSQSRPGAVKGYNCDEYPFASAKADSSNGHQENRCSRCVPTKENCKQGAAIARGYRDFCKNKAPCSFQVFFGNPGAGAHCNFGAQGNCNPDSAEQCTGSINIIEQRQQHEYEATAPDHPNGTFVKGPAQFRTYQGRLLDGPYGGFIGQAVYFPRSVNQTLHDELIARLECDEDGDDDQFSEITDNMVSDVDHIHKVSLETRLIGGG